MINILYIASPLSIHDIKWMTFFSQQKEKYKVYVVGEKQGNDDTIEAREKLSAQNIEVLDPIDSFSISSPFRTCQSISTLRSYISQYSIELVHILFATPHALWATYITVPYIITTRGSDALIVLPSLLKGTGIRGLYYKWLVKRFGKAFANAKINTSTSRAQADKLKELFQINNIEVIRTGVDIAKIESSKDTSLLNPELRNKDFVFSPRFMSPLYNIELQIDAIALLPKEALNRYIFVFIKGKAYNKEYFERMTTKLEALKSGNGVSYLILDYLGQEELWTYYNHAALTIMTPISDGTPNSALEAMAARCPLIMPDLNYDKYIFDNSCLVAKGNNPGILARLITQALTAYPAGLLDTAYQRVSERGNRAIEMTKLEKLYN